MALITVSGHLLDPSGAATAGSVVFQLTNYGANIPRVIGTNAVVATTVVFTANGSGAWSGSIQGNDTIDPGAGNTPPTTYYIVSFRDVAANVIRSLPFNFTGAGPANLDSQAPLNPVPSPTTPPNNAALLGANQTFTGNNTFQGTTTLGTVASGAAISSPTITGTDNGVETLGNKTLTMTSGFPTTPVFVGSGANPGITFQLTDNPGIPGAASYLLWEQVNSAGTAKKCVSVGPGMAVTTAGAEQAVWDMSCLINGSLKGLSIGGVSGGGNTFFVTPDSAGNYQLGLAGQGWLKVRMEGSAGPSIEFRDTNQSLAKGLHRLIESGDFVIDRNTAVAGDFSTHENDVIVSSTDGSTAVKRLKPNLGTAYTSADAAIALSGGWGGSATVSAAAGFDQALSFTVNASGTTGAGPTITVTFKDGTWAAAPQFIVLRNDGNTPYGSPPHTIGTTATTLTITFNGTPTSGTPYKYICMGFGN